MLTHLFRKLRDAGTAARALRPKASLAVEMLEGRDVPAIVYGVTAGNTLEHFDSNNPTAILGSVSITGLQTGTERVLGIDFSPITGQLVGTTATTGSMSGSVLRTYTINAATGVATLLGSTTSVPGAADLPTAYTIDPILHTIRLIQSNNSNIELNLTNGSLVSADTSLTYTAPATGPIVAAAYDRNFARASASLIPTTLYGIDRGSNTLDVIGSVNGTPNSPSSGLVTSVGSLGVTLDASSFAGFNIAPDIANNGTNGQGHALASLTVGGVTGLYNINLATGAATLIGDVGNGATQLTSLAIQRETVAVVGSQGGALADVRLIDAATGAVKLDIQPFPGFLGAVNVAAGDVTGDGIPDIIVAAIAPQAPIKVFDGITGALVQSFYAFPNFNGTVNIAAGDVNGDGYADVIVAAQGANGHVKAFSGRDGSLLASFFSYSGYLGSVSVAAGDLLGTGRAEIVTAAADNGHVKVFDSSGNLFTSPQLPNLVSSFFAYPGFLGDVYVAVGDVTGSGTPDLVVVSGAPTAGHVKAFSPLTGSPIASYIATNVTSSASSTLTGTIRGLALADVTGAGLDEILLTTGPGLQSNVTALNLTGTIVGTVFPAFANYIGGSTIAAAHS